MKYIEIIIISIALAMDAFSVSICKGISLKYKIKRNSLLIAISFSIFQMIMPIIGYFLGNKLNNYFITFNHIIAFIILTTIGINIATSIDAMAVGITFSLFKINLLQAILTIGFITFILCFIGVNIGKYIGKNYEKKAQIIGGIILIIMGLKSILEHFF